jgi:hypothetical protein
MTEYAPYRWKIDKDYLDGHAEKNAVGIEGPRNLDKNIKSNPQGFTLYDDDDIAYYHGWLYGDYEGFEPVDDFGLGYAGAPHIKFDGDEHYL